MNPPLLLPLTHRYEVRRTDLFIAQLMGAFFSKIAMGMLIILLLFAAYAGGSGEMPEDSSTILRVLCAIVSMLFVLVFWALLQLVTVAIMAFCRKNKGVACWHTLLLTEEGLIEKTDFNETLHRWNGLHKIRTTFGYYYIFVTETVFHLVPKRSFDSPQDAQRFMDEIRQRAAIK